MSVIFFLLFLWVGVSYGMFLADNLTPSFIYGLMKISHKKYTWLGLLTIYPIDIFLLICLFLLLLPAHLISQITKLKRFFIK